MHIGLIGGIGPAATELYYRGLVRPTSKPESFVIMWNNSPVQARRLQP